MRVNHPQKKGNRMEEKKFKAVCRRCKKIFWLEADFVNRMRREQHEKQGYINDWYCSDCFVYFWENNEI